MTKAKKSKSYPCWITELTESGARFSYTLEEGMQLRGELNTSDMNRFGLKDAGDTFRWTPTENGKLHGRSIHGVRNYSDLLPDKKAEVDYHIAEERFQRLDSCLNGIIEDCRKGTFSRRLTDKNVDEKRLAIVNTLEKICQRLKKSLGDECYPLRDSYMG
ncbi:MAG: hypothetical protein AABX07_00055 [Nanoarchaeota archaeon]